MATTMTPNTSSPIIVVGDKGGVTVVDPSTPLKRLNYYDGKFLRADDLDVEQDYLRHLVALSNQGLGAGVVYGFDTTLGSGDTIEIGPGLAVDPSGNVLLLQSSVKQNVQTLIEQSRTSATPASTSNGSSAGNASFSDCIQIAAPPPSTVVQVSDVYAIVICGAQALCGQSDVFGTLCEQACVTSTDRPYRLDGIVLRAIPLQLVTPFPTSSVVSIAGTATCDRRSRTRGSPTKCASIRARSRAPVCCRMSGVSAPSTTARVAKCRSPSWRAPARARSSSTSGSSGASASTRRRAATGNGRCSCARGTYSSRRFFSSSVSSPTCPIEPLRMIWSG